MKDMVTVCGLLISDFGNLGSWLILIIFWKIQVIVVDHKVSSRDTGGSTRGQWLF